jgi:NhaC family Na+:H+ antiporter
MTATLGVFSFAYLPFAFLNLICPIISVIYGYTGFTIAKASPMVPGESAGSAPERA